VSVERASLTLRLATHSLLIKGERPWLEALWAHWGEPFLTWGEAHQELSSVGLSSVGLSSAELSLTRDQGAGDQGGESQRCALLFERADLRVWARPERSSSYVAWVDGSFGAIEASAQVILQRLLRVHSGLLVHASAGVYQGEAWLIPGPSGAGKSTAARGGFERVLSDELVALTLEPQPMVWGTPFWSEGRDERRFPLRNEGLLLSALTFPHKAARPALSPLSALEAARLLTRCVTSYERAEESAELFSLSCAIAERVPAYRLSFPREGDWRATLR